MVKPICFMIMPYGRKATELEAGKGPGEIDFNALWDRVYVPVIEALGYEPVRADQDTAALIIGEMLERLYFADLVLADMTIANGNVYYEVGIRHASKENGCVLLAADWSRPLFDVAQMRTVRYPLLDGDIPEDTAQSIRDSIADKIAGLVRGTSPMHTTIKGFPDNVDPKAASSMKNHMLQLAELQATIRAVRSAPRNERMQRAKEILETYGQQPAMTSPVALALLEMLRDVAEDLNGWATVLDFIQKLPAELSTIAEVKEQRALALSNTGKHVEAIAQLEAIMEISGPTPERLGLLGGRYKRLFAVATAPNEGLQYLNKAIECYERGMELDLNGCYCAPNLPRLYRRRNRKGDEERAQSVLPIVIYACERAKKLGSTDEWLRPTLLGAAFDAGDANKAEELADEIAIEGAVRWKLDSVLTDLVRSCEHLKDKNLHGRMLAVIDTLKSLN